MTTDEINPYGKLVAQKRTDEINPYGKLVAQKRTVEIKAYGKLVTPKRTGKTKNLFHFRFWLRRRGCYGDFGHNMETGEEADYVGSSVDVRGRTNQHDRIIQKKAVAVEESLPKHYRVLRGRG
ncbi:hypothetical protein ABEF95_004142 [Exophiala dermatitidis]